MVMPSSPSPGSGFGHSGSTSKIGASTIAGACAVAVPCTITRPAPRPMTPAARSVPHRSRWSWKNRIIDYLPYVLFTTSCSPLQRAERCIETQTSPLAAHELQPEFLLGPQHHGPAVEKRHDGGLDRGRVAGAKPRQRHHRVALVVQGDRQQPLAGLVVHRIGAAEAVHPADLDEV